MTNARGDVYVTINKNVYGARPTFEAMSSIEDRLYPRTIFELLRDRTIPLKVITITLDEAIKAHPRDQPDVSYEDICQAVMEEGAAEFMEPVIKLLSVSVGGKKNSDPTEDPEMPKRVAPETKKK